jgi:CheY-like chemotaxis protein
MNRRLRIIVAVPESQTREELFELLHGLGHDVATVGNVRALLELYRSFEPDFMIAGGELREAAQEAAVPLVLLGGSPLPPEEVEAVLALLP